MERIGGKRRVQWNEVQCKPNTSFQAHFCFQQIHRFEFEIEMKKMKQRRNKFFVLLPFHRNDRATKCMCTGAKSDHVKKISNFYFLYIFFPVVALKPNIMARLWAKSMKANEMTAREKKTITLAFESLETYLTIGRPDFSQCLK